MEDKEMRRERVASAGYRGLYGTEGPGCLKEIDFPEPVEYLVPTGDHEGRQNKKSPCDGSLYFGTERAELPQRATEQSEGGPSLSRAPEVPWGIERASDVTVEALQ